VLRREARCSSSSSSLDSSIQREVHLYRRVARRIDVPHLQVACFAHVIGRSYQIHWIRRCIVKDRAKQSSSGQCPLDPDHWSLAGSLGTPHVSYIISINKDKVPPVRVYVSLKQNCSKRTKNGNVKRFENKNKVSDKRIQKQKISRSTYKSIQASQHWFIRIVYSYRIQVMMLAKKRDILSKQPSYEPPCWLKGSVHVDSQPSSPWRKT
jgi:hypothetical protein